MKKYIFNHLKKIKGKDTFVFRLLYGLKKTFNFYLKITINNKKVILPIIHGVGFGNVIMSEPWMIALIEKICRHRNGAFIDVGFNIGQTLIKVKSVEFDIPYYGFEPNPNCYSYAMELIKVNEFTNCELFPVGLFNKDDVVTLTLFSSSKVGSGASLIDGFRAPSQKSMKLNVPVFKGDDLLAKIAFKSISVLKIDVEGGELEVMQGLRNTLFKFQPYIICEMLPIYEEMTEIGRFRKKRQAELEKELKENGYRIFRTLENGNMVALDSIDTHSDLSLCNYVFVPQSEIFRFYALFEIKN